MNPAANMNEHTAIRRQTRRKTMVAVLFAALTGGIQAQETPAAPSDAAADKEVNTASVKVANLQTADGVAEREKAINDVIRAAFNAKSTEGVWQTLAGKKLVEIDPHAVALAALNKNLSIQVSHLNKEIAAAALDEARALFDPVLNLSFNYSDSRDFLRNETVARFHKATVHCTGVVATDPPECAVINNDPNLDPGGPGTGVYARSNDFLFFSSGSPVQFLGYTQPRPAIYKVQSQVAHPDGVTGDNEQYNADFTVTQLLPWGPSLSFNYETVYKTADFINNPDSPQVSAGSYHRPWTVNTSLSLTMPLPGSAGFGPDAAQADVDVHKSLLGNEQAVWNVKDVINSTLLVVDITFWNLVGATNNFYAALENQRSVEQLLKKTEEMYQLREITDYNLSQVQAELERVKNQVEQTKNAYISASNALQPLLDSGADVVYLPIQYSVSLVTPLEVDPAQLRREDVAMNPVLQAEDYNVQLRDVDVKQSDINRQPNLTLNANPQWLQSNSVFGYSEWPTAMNKFFSPDIITQTYTLRLVRQWGNQALESQYAGNKALLEREKLILRSAENTQVHNLSDATVGLISARARTDIARRNWQLAQTAYQKSVDQQRARTVTEYEIILQSQNLLQATNNWISAVISAKEAEASVLAARGELVAKYAERTAQTAAEEGRVKALAMENIIPLFAGKVFHDR
ncbi:MAG TPA: TolC family protein [Gammaproteobacteria bacterium]|nr:TolC family protein [Gammaproteobacteria bacterium]